MQFGRSDSDREAFGVVLDQAVRGSHGCSSVYWFPRFSCKQGILVLLFKGAWGELLSGLGSYSC